MLLTGEVCVVEETVRVACSIRSFTRAAQQGSQPRGGTVGPRDTDGFVAELPDNRPTIAFTKFDGEDSLAMCHAKGPVRQ